MSKILKVGFDKDLVSPIISHIIEADGQGIIEALREYEDGEYIFLVYLYHTFSLLYTLTMSKLIHASSNKRRYSRVE